MFGACHIGRLSGVNPKYRAMFRYCIFSLNNSSTVGTISKLPIAWGRESAPDVVKRRTDDEYATSHDASTQRPVVVWRDVWKVFRAIPHASKRRRHMACTLGSHQSAPQVCASQQHAPTQRAQASRAAEAKPSGDPQRPHCVRSS